jgi:hypothetical protein
MYREGTRGCWKQCRAPEKKQVHAGESPFSFRRMGLLFFRYETGNHFSAIIIAVLYIQLPREYGPLHCPTGCHRYQVRDLYIPPRSGLNRHLRYRVYAWT